MDEKSEKRTAELKKSLHEGREQLRALRDEIRVHLHLGSMELKDRWAALEPRFSEAERYVEELTETSRAAMKDLVKRFSELRDSLARLREQHKVGRHPS
jgi:hypothetical protein